jgi:antitoxin StbD
LKKAFPEFTTLGGLFYLPCLKLIRPFNSANISTIKDTFGTIMSNLVLTEMTASVSELKRNPMGTVAAGEGFPIAILNRNAPAFYCVPAKAYEALMERLDDLELNALADARKDQPVIKVNLNDL